MFKKEEFVDASGKQLLDASGSKPQVTVTSGKVPEWKTPKAGDEQFLYTTVFIVLILIAIVSLSLFVYTFAKGDPSYLYATIGLSSLIIFMLVYLSKYE